MLTGKNAIISGSTSGIGLGIAEQFARARASVMLNGLGDAQEIEMHRCRLQAMGEAMACYHPADMTRPDEIAEMIAYAEACFGRVDILVNNAGIQHVAPLEMFPTDKWDAILAINLTSAFHTTRLALGAMKERGWGRIINIASTAKARGISEDEVKRDVLLEAQPTKQFVTVEQLGVLAVFLCQDAAGQITGTALPADGGWTAH